MSPDMEIALTVTLALFFQLLYFYLRLSNESYQAMAMATLTAILWFIAGNVYLGLEPTFYGNAYIFTMLGWINVLLVLEQVFRGFYAFITKSRRRGDVFE